MNIDNRGMVFGLAVFVTCILFGILAYIGIYYAVDKIYATIFSDLQLSSQGSASLSALIALWGTIPAVILFAAAWWLINHIHNRGQTV